MKLRFAFLLLLLPVMILGVQALQVLPGTGIKDTDQSKDFHFRYHNLSDDYHLQGPLKWAVRFNFREYAVQDSATFNINAIRIYNPLTGTGSDLKLRLTLRNEIAVTSYTGLVIYYPGTTVYATTTLNGVPNGADIPLAGVQDSLKVAWLVIELLEPVTGRYLTASEGSGNNSYYYFGPPNTEEANYWRSLREAGYLCELRFGAVGTFNLNTPRLQLSDFSLGTNLSPGSRIYPSFRVYNHSAAVLNDSLLVQFIGPDGSGFSQESRIPVNNLVAQDYSSFFYQTGIMLPDSPMQLKMNLSFTQNSAYAISPKHVNVFPEPTECVLAEHFIGNSAALGALPADTEQVHHLIYVPNQVDKLSNLDAFDRYNFYQFNSLPKTVVMGDKRFHMQVNSDSLQAAISSAIQQKTFINRSSCTITAADTINIMNRNFSFTLQNDNTNFDPWTANFSPKFFAGIFEANSVSGRLSYVIKHWLAFNLSVPTLDQGQSFSNTALYNVTDLDSLKSYRVYYWLQDSFNNGTKIYFANWQPFQRPVSNSDDNIVPAMLSVYPNPLRRNETMKTSSFSSPTRVSIYNLKGQLIFRESVQKGDISVPSAIFPTSGIYFLRSESLSVAYNAKQTTKITVIK